MSIKESVTVASEIFKEHRKTIRDIAKRRAPKQCDVEDICQDIFLAIVRGPPSHGTSLLSYFKTVVRNYVTDSYRRAASHRSFVKGYSGVLRNIAVGDGPETEVDQAEQVRKAMELIRCALPPYMAHVLVDRYAHGKSIDEIALQMGIEKRTVSRYCCVGLKRLRHLLAE